MVTDASPNGLSPSLGAPWELTRALSPRPAVAVAAVDAHGNVLNSYGRQHRIDADQPNTPWAMYLADRHGRFHFIGLDLDAKAPHGAADVAHDLDVLTGHLDELHIEHVVTDSGSAGSRHVWIALQEPAPAQLVGDLAIAAKLDLPTLDYGMLRNPARGCLRPPGTPHRSGGQSTIIHGHLSALRHATTTPAQLRALTERLGTDSTTPRTDTPDAVLLPRDSQGMPYLPGARRHLPARSEAARNTHIGDSDDASAVQWVFLLGAAASRWTWSDVEAELGHAPGLEHARTHRDGSGRTPRPPEGPTSPVSILRRDWNHAVAHVARSPRRTGDDETFDARAGALAQLVDELQTRADAAAGRWSRGGGPADRRVLDALAMLALEAMTSDIEADVRRLAQLTGIGRETARTALHRLAGDGWICRTREADGPHGAHWSIDPKNRFSTLLESARSQAVPPRAPGPRAHEAGTKERSHLLQLLQARRHAHAHDIFTGTSPALGIQAGNVYAQLHSLRRPARDEPATTSTLTLLAMHGLAKHDGHEWRAVPLSHRESVAHTLGVAGRLEARTRHYEIERAAWAWWSAEHERVSSPGRHQAGPPGQGVLSLLDAPQLRSWQRWPAFPRRGRDRRWPDHAAARAAIATGLVSVAPTQSAPLNRAPNAA